MPARIVFKYDEKLLGGASIDAHGTALTDDTLKACKRADAVLLAAVGGPKWDTTDPSAPRPEQGLLGLTGGFTFVDKVFPGTPATFKIDIPSAALCPAQIDRIKAFWDPGPDGLSG